MHLLSEWAHRYESEGQDVTKQDVVRKKINPLPAVLKETMMCGQLCRR